MFGFLRSGAWATILVVLGLVCLGVRSADLYAQTGPDAGVSAEELQMLAAEAARDTEASPDSAVNEGEKASINLKELLIKGGLLMIPIAVMSLVVVTVTLERAFVLRTSRIYPRAIRREVKSTIDDTATGTPQSFYEIAKKYPSAQVVLTILAAWIAFLIC